MRRALHLLTLSILLTVALIVGSPSAASGATPPPRCPKWEPLLRKYGLPVREFSRIMWRESRCVPQAVGWNYRPGKGPDDCRHAPFDQYRHCRAVRTFDSGLLQVNSSWVTVTRTLCGKTPQQGALFDPRCNLTVARYLYDNGGLGHWRATSGA